MADITSALQKMNDQEISSDAALSQALFLKLGANINGLIDRGNRRAQFTSSGTWVSPGDVTTVTLYGAGGGGGGGGGQRLSTRGSAGQGGAGAVPTLVTVNVSPNTSYAVTIGAGGAGGNAASDLIGNGSSGTATLFGSLATFAGAGGGVGGNIAAVANGYASSLGVFAGGGYNEANGQASVTAKGGVPTSPTGANGQSGGGGGAGVSAGGNGGAGARYQAAQNGFPGATSAGGGGGGNVFEDRQTYPAYNGYSLGGAGGPGYLLIMY